MGTTQEIVADIVGAFGIVCIMLLLGIMLYNIVRLVCWSLDQIKSMPKW